MSDRIVSAISSAVGAGPVGMVYLHVYGRCWVHEVCHCPHESAMPASDAPERRTYTRPVIETSAQPGFLSLGQAVARRMALQAVEHGRAGRTLLVHGPAGSGKGAFVDDLLALHFCDGSGTGQRPCNACRGCRAARARSHPDLVIGSPDALARAARLRREHRRGRAALAAGCGGGADRRGSAGRADRARRPRQRADPERAPQGARGADRSPRVHPRRRRARARCFPPFGRVASRSASARCRARSWPRS